MRRKIIRKPGPKTDEAKARVSQNALKHGLYSTHAILRDEDPAELEHVRQEVYAELKPQGFMEEVYADRAVTAIWRLRRARQASPTPRPPASPEASPSPTAPCECPSPPGAGPAARNQARKNSGSLFRETNPCLERSALRMKQTRKTEKPPWVTEHPHPRFDYCIEAGRIDDAVLLLLGGLWLLPRDGHDDFLSSLALTVEAADLYEPRVARARAL